MAESIRFDFLSTGADKLAGDFRKTGDNAAAAARGAKVLQDVIDKLGQKENRTAAESRLLADALRKTGDAEDRAAAKAVAADAAIRRLDDAIKANERDALEAAAANRALGDSLGKLAEKAGGPSLKGSLLALSPATIPLAGGIAAGVGAIGASFGAAALGAGLFAKAATSVLSGASSDLQKLQALEAKANTARTAAQKKAAEQQIKTLEASWSKGYLAMIGSLKDFQAQWKSTSQQIAVPALTAGIKALSDGIGFLKPALTPVAAVFTQWGQAIDRYFTSSKGSAEMNRLAAAFGRFSASQLKDIGVFIVDIGRGVFNLGQDIAQYNINFGAFGAALDRWGAAFTRWSTSEKARTDVGNFLTSIRANGGAVAGLLKNLGGALSAFAPGLTSVGALELRLVSDFLGVLAHTPKAVAKPLLDVAGALLLLQKTGVLKVGIKVAGPALKWLTGGLINIGGGATAAAEIRAAFASGGAAAAAEIRAAMASGGAAAAAEIGGGGAAAGAAAGEAAGASLAAALGPAVLGITLGAAIALWVNQYRTAINQHPAPAGQQGARSFQSPSSAETNAWKQYDKAVKDTGDTYDVAKAKAGVFAGVMQNRLNTALAASGTHADALRISHLGPLGSKIDSVNRETGILQGTIANPAHLAAGGQHADTFRNAHLAPLQSKIDSVNHQTQILQTTINSLHGKTIDVGVHGSGSGGAKITVSSVGGGAFAGKLVAISNRALGGFISGGTPGQDSVPAMLMPGELVVPTSMVQAGAVDHLKGRLPGFAGGGLVNPSPFVTGTEGSYGADSKGAIGGLASAAYKAIVASVTSALQAQAAAAASSGGGVNASPARTGSVAVEQAYAFSLFPRYGWGASQEAPLIALWNQESGWNPYAVNPNGGAYGIPQSLGHGHPYNLGDYQAQIQWGENYIKSIYGSPAAAWAHEVAHNWYKAGGLVPGYATGGKASVPPRVPAPPQGYSAWLGRLKGYQGHEYGDWAGLWWSTLKGPAKYRTKPMLAALKAAEKKEYAEQKAYAAILKHSSGSVADINAQPGLIAALHSAVGGEQSALKAAVLSKKPGGHPGYVHGLQGWLADIAGITGAGRAALQVWKPGNLGPSHSVGGGVLTFDQGGLLPPGMSLAYNGTGRPEPVIPAGRGAGGGVPVVLEVSSGGGSEFEQFMLAMIRRFVRVKGGGSAQAAFGRN